MKKIYTIGRDASCDIVIHDNTDVVSRMHATLRIESKNKYYLTDQSTNGTYVNGMRMTANVEVPVTRKDVVSFAHVYNLDWASVPKTTNIAYIIVAIIILSLMAGGLLFGLKYHKQKNTSINENGTDKNIVIPDSMKVNPNKDAVISDSVKIAEDTTNPHKETPAPNENVKEKKKVDKPVKEEKKEEIFDALY